VNAVLRRAVREAPALLQALDDSTPASAAVLHSVPEWLADKWWRELGADRTRSLLGRVNEPAESVLRVNTLVSTTDAAAAALPAPTHRASELPEALMLDGPFDTHGSGLWRDGAIMPQSRASMLVARTVDPRPGERVLDLCAAPGGKTTHLAALLEDRGEIVAVERHSGRADALTKTCARMRASCVRVEVGDAATPRSGALFDRVLVDPPCSGLGTLQSRPDLRWRASPEAIGEMAAVQARILAAGAASTASGGVLVYSVCTISRAEAQDLIGGFLAANREFHTEHDRQLLPDRDRTDGFYIARLRRD
jgi:16S rRNA (cytosine967-C5)-methyltransferase